MKTRQQFRHNTQADDMTTDALLSNPLFNYPLNSTSIITSHTPPQYIHGHIGTMQDVYKGVGRVKLTYFLADGRGEDVSPKERHFAA